MTINDQSSNGNVDVIESARRRMDRAYQQISKRDAPFITVTYAQSLDGCIAGCSGETIHLSSRESQTLTHKLRAIHDAILVGINTVVRDNPRLNVRLVEGPNPQPVVVDTKLRFPLDSSLLHGPCVRPIVFASEHASDDKARQLQDAGAKVVRVTECKHGLLDLFQVFTHLRRDGYRSVMVEGGASIITSMLASGLAQQYLLTISPRLVAGMHAVKPQLGRMPQLCNLEHQWLGKDLILRGDLFHEPDRVSVGRPDDLHRNKGGKESQ